MGSSGDEGGGGGGPEGLSSRYFLPVFSSGSGMGKDVSQHDVICSNLHNRITDD